MLTDADRAQAAELLYEHAYCADRTNQFRTAGACRRLARLLEPPAPAQGPWWVTNGGAEVEVWCV